MSRGEKSGLKEAGSFRRGWEGGVPYAHSVEAQSRLQAGGCAQGLLPSLNYVNGQSWAQGKAGSGTWRLPWAWPPNRNKRPSGSISECR